MSDTNETRAQAAASGVVIGGLDGATPLGFLAALGLFRVLSERERCESPEVEPSLSWERRDTWRPVLHAAGAFEHLVDAVVDDAACWANAPVLGFRYVKVEKSGPKVAGGLKASAAVLRAFLIDRQCQEDEATLAYAAALMSEEVTEDIKNAATFGQHEELGIGVSSDAPLDRAVDRTYFDFTARNAQFLEQVELVRAHIDRERILAGLERAEVDPSTPSNSLDWDPAADTPGAIYTGFRRGFLPVHLWLAFRGLVFLPLASRRGKVVTTACSGRRLDGQFTWPLWVRPIGSGAVYSLVGYPRLAKLSADQRRAFGLAAVFCASLTKKADGRSGMFSPSRPT